MTWAEQKASESAVNPGHSQQKSKVGPRPHFLINRFAVRDTTQSALKLNFAYHPYSMIRRITDFYFDRIHLTGSHRLPACAGNAKLPRNSDPAI
jgi:hypothetical protein